MEPCIIFGIFNISKTVASYLGLIESVDKSVKKLLHQQFLAAQSSLEQAKNTKNEHLRKEYLKSALHSFNLAIAVEENENLISSYVGLAMCQFLLGDKENYESSLKKASSTKLKIREKIIAEGKQLGKETLIRFMKPSLMIIDIINGVASPKNILKNSGWNQRQRIFNDYKSKALNIQIQE